MKKLLAVVLGIVVVFASACTSDFKRFNDRGFNVDKNHQLLALSTYSENKSDWGCGGAFLFIVGGGGCSGSSSTQHKIGFVLKTDTGTITVLRFNADIVDYRLDKNAKVPYVRLYFDHPHDSTSGGCFSSYDSLTQNIQGCTERAILYLAPSDFSKDVAVIQFAGAIGG